MVSAWDEGLGKADLLRFTRYTTTFMTKPRRCWSCTTFFNTHLLRFITQSIFVIGQIDDDNRKLALHMVTLIVIDLIDITFSGKIKQ